MCDKLIILFVIFFYFTSVLDVRDSTETERSSYANNTEAELILRTVEAILSSPELLEKSVGIITLFEKQRSLVQQLIEGRL